MSTSRVHGWDIICTTCSSAELDVPGMDNTREYDVATGSNEAKIDLKNGLNVVSRVLKYPKS